MSGKFTIRIETSRPAKSLLPWIAVQRPGRQRVDSSCFMLAGYPASTLAAYDRRGREYARETLEYVLRLFSAFEYIPRDDNAVEEFFERKMVAFEDKIRGLENDAPFLHAVLGIVCGSKIIFAASGDILILQSGGSSLTNLGDTRGEDTLHFQSFQSGTLGQKTYLLMTPKSIGAVFKSEELKQLALARASERKLEFLERLWDKRTIEQQAEEFRALVIEAKSKLTRPEGSTAVSIAHLLDTEAQTEEMLSPPLLRPFFKYLHSLGLTCMRGVISLKKRLQSYLQRVQREKAPLMPHQIPPKSPRLSFLSSAKQKMSVLPDETVLLNDKIQQSPLALSPNLKRISRGIRERLAKMSGLPVRVFSDTSASTESIPYHARHYLRLKELLALKFNTLPIKSKVMLFLLITFVFLSIQGILIANQRAEVHASIQELNDERNQIQARIDAANSALIYEDETAARDHNQSAEALFTSIMARTDRAARNMRAGFLEFEKPLNELRARLRHEITIDAPAPIDEPLAAALALTENPAPIASYGERRYELRASDNQILRREKSAEGFNSGSPWIQDGTDVRNAVSIAIDGAVYVGIKDGTVLRLLKGRKNEFALLPVDPPLTAMVKLWTDDNSDYLYVLDAQEKRLLAFTKKDGLLRAQYICKRALPEAAEGQPSEKSCFTNLKDFKINEGAKVAYLLDGEQTISIPLSHF